jgi:hypothetical protein
MPRHFPPKIASQIAATKYLYIRAGDEHRFIPVWVVVVDGRAIVRPWNDRKAGWYRAFLVDPNGAIRLGDREIPVKAVSVKSARLSDLVDAAYAEKYTTKANQKYVRGFKSAKRRATTTELVPR